MAAYLEIAIILGARRGIGKKKKTMPHPVAVRANASIKIRKNHDKRRSGTRCVHIICIPYTFSSINNVLLMIYGVSRNHCLHFSVL